jgi:tetratricopeptide (TPR) repeat protein
VPVAESSEPKSTKPPPRNINLLKSNTIGGGRRLAMRMSRAVHLIVCTGWAGTALLILNACDANRAHHPAPGVNANSAQASALTPPDKANQAKPQGVSLLGKPLIAPALPDDVRQRRERDLETAQFEYDRDPHNEEAIIWLGRRQAYLGRYDEAINTFSNGLAIHPDSYRLLRHRGHRYITLRTFDLAHADLSRAAGLIRGVPDEVEPDGQPNAQNVPTSTSHTNIFYHLGLASYLRGDFPGAAAAYKHCLSFAKNDDMRIATLYWHYLTLRRFEQDEDAQRILDSVSPDMNVIENRSYHRLLLMYKGELSPDDAVKPSDDNQPLDIDLATTGYAAGMWHLLRGERDKAKEHFRRIVDQTNWAAFGHIAAEVELADPKRWIMHSSDLE